MYDVIIIGAGIIGGAVARQLSRHKLSVLCLEKEADVCCGTSKANTGIIHSPALIPSGTKKSELAVQGGLAFEGLSRELGFEYQRTGSLILGFDQDDEAVMTKYIETGVENYRNAGIEPPDYQIIRGDRLREIEPSLNPDVFSALFAPDTGRIIPYEYGIALWENAVENGVELRLNSCVETVVYSESVNEMQSFYKLTAGGKEYRSRFIINASGHGSSGLGLQAGFHDGEIQAVKGQYLILDRERGPAINHILFQVPQSGEKKKGKGILVTRTVYGNIMIGPDAQWQDGEADTSTDIQALDAVVGGALKSIPGLQATDCIKTFAGVRPKPAGGDFIIESRKGFVHLCGIESPGLTSSPAIAAEAVRLCEAMGLELLPRSDFQPLRRPIVIDLLHLDVSEVKKRVGLKGGEADRLVCRCEQVPEERIIDALGRGIPVVTIDGVKRRTRAGQGRCQGSFCGSRVRSLLAAELGLSEDEITQRGSEGELERVSAAEIRARYK